MKLSAVQQYWDRQAHADPMWAILTDPAKAGGRWDADEFFATGVREVGVFMDQAAAWGSPLARRSALDFGCGIGRLSQALAEHFDQVYGVDISPKMIELARQHNRKGARVRVPVQSRRRPEPFRGRLDRHDLLLDHAAAHAASLCAAVYARVPARARSRRAAAVSVSEQADLVCGRASRDGRRSCPGRVRCT